MTETAEAIKIQRGLKGVYFDRSPCTFIDGRAGELLYRGYSIHELAEQSSFEETAWLLLHGEDDDSVPSAESERLHAASGKGSTELRIVHGTGHTFGAKHPLEGIPEPLERTMQATVNFFGTHLT